MSESFGFFFPKDDALVVFLTKWHRVLGTRQSVMYVRGPAFEVFLLIQLKFTRTASGSTDVFKFCQYAFIIYSKLCVDISWPFHSQNFHTCLPYISHFVRFDNLVFNESISFTCGWYLSLFSFNTCSLDNNIYHLLTYRSVNTSRPRSEISL